MTDASRHQPRIEALGQSDQRAGSVATSFTTSAPRSPVLRCPGELYCSSSLVHSPLLLTLMCSRRVSARHIKLDSLPTSSSHPSRFVGLSQTDRSLSTRVSFPRLPLPHIHLSTSNFIPPHIPPIKTSYQSNLTNINTFTHSYPISPITKNRDLARTTAPADRSVEPQGSPIILPFIGSVRLDLARFGDPSRHERPLLHTPLPPLSDRKWSKGIAASRLVADSCSRPDTFPDAAEFGTGPCQRIERTPCPIPYRALHTSDKPARSQALLRA